MIASAIKKGGFWAFVPVALLGGLVAMVLGFVHVALSDPSFAVQDRYYSRALSWDEHLAAERRNVELGWRTRLHAARIPGGNIVLDLALVDRNEKPISGARIDVDAFPIARSRRSARATFTGQASGGYRAELRADRGGRWEFAIDAMRGGNRFTESVRLEVPEAAPP